MTAPTPPPGYRLLTDEEKKLPLPEGARFKRKSWPEHYPWEDSTKVGYVLDDGTQQDHHYAIPTAPDAKAEAPIAQSAEVKGLLPCPFCGGRAISTVDGYAICELSHRSPASGCAGAYIAVRITAWNTRDTAELDAMRGELAKVKQESANKEGTIRAFGETLEKLRADLARAQQAREDAEKELGGLVDELEELRQYKAEVDAEGVIPASVAQLLDDTQAALAEAKEREGKLREALTEYTKGENYCSGGPFFFASMAQEFATKSLAQP